jgi:hypothetical protein
MATTQSGDLASAPAGPAGYAPAGPADGQPEGQPPAATHNEAMGQAVSALQDKVNTALLSSDGRTLDDLVSPTAVIIGPRGFMISRDEWIDVHQSADYRQVKLETLEATVHAYDSAVIHCDVMDSECLYQGQTITGHFQVTHVWVTDHQRWQLASVQYTALQTP